MQELRQRILSVLPELPRGIYVGTSRAHDCCKNSLREARRSDLEVYVGHLMFISPAHGSWTATPHVFNVRKGFVVEMTNLQDLNWNNCLYFGSRVTKRTPQKNVWDSLIMIPRNI